MKKVGFIGAYDKTDLIIYIAKILTQLGNKVLVVDATLTQKAKYIVPALGPTMSYITEFEEIDIAVGFRNLEMIAGYSNKEVDRLDYDYILLDIDNAENAINYRIEESIENFFVTSYDMYEIRRGLEVLASFPQPINMEKVIFTREIRREDDDYLNYLSLETNARWENDRIYFPIEVEDKMAIINNQKVSKIRFDNLSKMYKDGMICIIIKLMPEIPDSRIKKIMKEI